MIRKRGHSQGLMTANTTRGVRTPLGDIRRKPVIIEERTLMITLSKHITPIEGVILTEGERRVDILGIPSLKGAMTQGD